MITFLVKTLLGLQETLNRLQSTQHHHHRLNTEKVTSIITNGATFTDWLAGPHSRGFPLEAERFAGWRFEAKTACCLFSVNTSEAVQNTFFRYSLEKYFADSEVKITNIGKFGVLDGVIVFVCSWDSRSVSLAGFHCVAHIRKSPITEVTAH